LGISVAGRRIADREVGFMDGKSAALAEAVQEVNSRIKPLRQGEFSARLDKVSVYVQSAAKSQDPKTLSNFIRFAHLNLDAVLEQALVELVYRPRLATKADEQKKSAALQKTFDRLDEPEKAMLEHYQSSSDPLNKYLVAGPWGHEYLRKRGMDLEKYDRQLYAILGCEETAGGKVMLAYAGLRRAIDRIEAIAVGAP
jgi:CRISPR/Cas system-associated protein Cas10 (large subunit of type III CRISPR-Cas system)